MPYTIKKSTNTFWTAGFINILNFDVCFPNHLRYPFGGNHILQMHSNSNMLGWHSNSNMCGVKPAEISSSDSTSYSQHPGWAAQRLPMAHRCPTRLPSGRAMVLVNQPYTSFPLHLHSSLSLSAEWRSQGGMKTVAPPPTPTPMQHKNEFLFAFSWLANSITDKQGQISCEKQLSIYFLSHCYW